MFESQQLTGTQAEQYEQLLQQATALVHGEGDKSANAANLSALVYHSLPGLNWVGFYFYDGNELVVGPFQGLPACVRIALGRGVCGAAAVTKQTQRIADVDAFPGHIPCDDGADEIEQRGEKAACQPDICAKRDDCDACDTDDHGLLPCAGLPARGREG